MKKRTQMDEKSKTDQFLDFFEESVEKYWNRSKEMEKGLQMKKRAKINEN
jgi:hypothetical protein